MTVLVTAAVHGVGDEKTSYVGGTPRDFPVGGFTERLDAFARGTIRPIEGSLAADSASELTFEAGRDGRLVIAYRDVTALSFGLDRALMVAELDKAQLDLEWLPVPEGAQIVLRFRGQQFHRPGYLQALYGGRGEVSAIQDGRPRTVAFSGTRMRAFGDKPATKFAAAFIAAYREGNR